MILQESFLYLIEDLLIMGISIFTMLIATQWYVEFRKNLEKDISNIKK